MIYMNMKQLEKIQNRIYEVRGVRVMLDFDLAALYQVETRVLKQAVRRNLERFPEDFMFEMTENEYNLLIIKIPQVGIEPTQTILEGLGLSIRRLGLIISSLLILNRKAINFPLDKKVF